MAGNHNAGKASVSGEAATVLQKATFPMTPFSRRKQSEFETSFAVVSSRMPSQ
jgi:hypothetical protein